MNDKRKQKDAQVAQKRETLWRRLFSVSTTGLVIAVLGGRQYMLSSLTGVVKGYQDISAECGAIPRNLGGCVIIAKPSPGGQDTIKLLIQPL